MENKTEYLETHFEVVRELVEAEEWALRMLEKSNRQDKGVGGLWVLAEEITDAFQEKYKNEDWIKLNWLETVWEFVGNYKI